MIVRFCGTAGVVAGVAAALDTGTSLCSACRHPPQTNNAISKQTAPFMSFIFAGSRMKCRTSDVAEIIEEHIEKGKRRQKTCVDRIAEARTLVRAIHSISADLRIVRTQLGRRRQGCWMAVAESVYFKTG